MRFWLIATVVFVAVLVVSGLANAQQASSDFLTIRECPLQVAGEATVSCTVTPSPEPGAAACRKRLAAISRILDAIKAAGLHAEFGIALRVEPGATLGFKCESEEFEILVR